MAPIPVKPLESSDLQLSQSQAATVTPGHNPARNPVRSGVQLLPTRQIRIIGVPLDLGQMRRGVDMGPSAVRVAGLQENSKRLVTV